MARSKARHLARVVARTFDSSSQRPVARSITAHLHSSPSVADPAVPIPVAESSTGAQRAHGGCDHHWASASAAISQKWYGLGRNDLGARFSSAGVTNGTSWPLGNRMLSTVPNDGEESAIESNTAVGALSDATEAPPSSAALSTAELAGTGSEADVAAAEDDGSGRDSGAASPPSDGIKGVRPGRSERMQKINEEMEASVKEKVPHVQNLTTDQLNAELSQLLQRGKHLDVLATFYAWRKVSARDATEEGGSNEGSRSAAPMAVQKLHSGDEAVTWNYAMIALMKLGRPARAVEVSA